MKSIEFQERNFEERILITNVTYARRPDYISRPELLVLVAKSSLFIRLPVRDKG